MDVLHGASTSTTTTTTTTTMSPALTPGSDYDDRGTGEGVSVDEDEEEDPDEEDEEDEDDDYPGSVHDGVDEEEKHSPAPVNNPVDEHKPHGAPYDDDDLSDHHQPSETAPASARPPLIDEEDNENDIVSIANPNFNSGVSSRRPSTHASFFARPGILAGEFVFFLLVLFVANFYFFI